MSMARRFRGLPVSRLIVSVPDDLVAAVDSLLRLARHHPARGNRAEFVRLAIAEKLARDKPPARSEQGRNRHSDDFSTP